jgi:hypothetical protein
MSRQLARFTTQVLVLCLVVFLNQQTKITNPGPAMICVGNQVFILFELRASLPNLTGAKNLCFIRV